MTLENTLRQQLAESASGGFHIQAGNWNVTLASDRGDSLSCALNELALDRAEPIAEQLQPWADRIARQATGLLESLRLVEVDTVLGKAMLRSAAPAMKDGKACYYELLLERTGRTLASLKRYAADRETGRDAVPFVLTHDAIVKLVLDIAGTN